MKFLHISDLHIGKRVNEFSMIEDQKYILNEILRIIDKEAPDGVLLAGDLYDRPIPSAEAVQLFDRFLTQLAERKIPVYAISGNHDSAERIAFGSQIMSSSGICMTPVYDGKTEKYCLTDSYGEVWIHLLPFVRPATVRHGLEGEEEVDEIRTYQEAVQAAVAHMEIDKRHRNVLIAHQFVVGAMRCDSEEISVGGIDQVEADVFRDFDYVALGHIHRAQRIGKRQCYYSGTPLKYSVSEASHEKSFQIVELGEKGQEPLVRKKQLKPLRELCVLRGTLQEVLEQREHAKDFVSITLTDEEEPYMPKEQLELVFDHILEIRIDNERTRRILDLYEEEEETESLFESFASFFETVQGRSMNEAEQEAAQDAWNEIIEGGAE